MTPVPPSDSDLATIRETASLWSAMAIGLETTPAGKGGLWIALGLDPHELERLWRHQGLARDGSLARKYATLLQSPDLALKVTVHKFRRAFFSYHWIGNAEFVSTGSGEAVYVGSVRGKTQPEMWQHLKQFRAMTTTIFRDPTSAMARR